MSRSRVTSSSPLHEYSRYVHWLMKNEPPYSLTRLSGVSDGVEPWIGVRNTEAANIMRVHMRREQRVFYYEANVPNPHISGIAVVHSAAHVDDSAYDVAHKYYDAKSAERRAAGADALWHCVDVKFQTFLRRPVFLAELKAHAALANMQVLRRRRLSISAVTADEWNAVMALAATDIDANIARSLKHDARGNIITKPTRTADDGTIVSGANSADDTVALSSAPVSASPQQQTSADQETSKRRKRRRIVTNDTESKT